MWVSPQAEVICVDTPDVAEKAGKSEKSKNKKCRLFRHTSSLLNMWLCSLCFFIYYVANIHFYLTFPLTGTDKGKMKATKRKPSKGAVNLCICALKKDQ